MRDDYRVLAALPIAGFSSVAGRLGDVCRQFFFSSSSVCVFVVKRELSDEAG